MFVLNIQLFSMGSLKGLRRQTKITIKVSIKQNVCFLKGYYIGKLFYKSIPFDFSSSAVHSPVAFAFGYHGVLKSNLKVLYYIQCASTQRLVPCLLSTHAENVFV